MTRWTVLYLCPDPVPTDLWPVKLYLNLDGRTEQFRSGHLSGYRALVLSLHVLDMIALVLDYYRLPSCRFKIMKQFPLPEQRLRRNGVSTFIQFLMSVRVFDQHIAAARGDPHPAIPDTKDMRSRHEHTA
jgi:hypothetical protein